MCAMEDGQDLNLVRVDAIGSKVWRPGDHELPRSSHAAFAAGVWVTREHAH